MQAVTGGRSYEKSGTVESMALRTGTKIALAAAAAVVVVAGAVTLRRQREARRLRRIRTLSKSYLRSSHAVATREDLANIWEYRGIDYLTAVHPITGVWQAQVEPHAPFFGDFETEEEAVRAAEDAIDELLGPPDAAPARS